MYSITSRTFLHWPGFQYGYSAYQYMKNNAIMKVMNYINLQLYY